MRKYLVAGIITGALALSGGIAAAAVSQSGPAIIPGGNVYSSIVHVCIDPLTRAMYPETHTGSGVIGNCANGYVQAEINAPYLPVSFPVYQDKWSGTTAGATPVPVSTEQCTVSQNVDGPNGTDPNQVTGITCVPVPSPTATATP